MTDPVGVLELIHLPVDDWRVSCDHRKHASGSRGHDDTSAVMVVAGIPLTCCGLTAVNDYLCASYITANPFLRCPTCDRNGIPFEDCYRVLGDANG